MQNKSLIVLLLLLNLFTSLNGQQGSIGLKIGYDYPIVHRELRLLVSNQSAQMLRPLSFGVFTQKSFGGIWNLEGSLSYHQRGEVRQAGVTNALTTQSLLVKTELIELQVSNLWYPFGHDQVRPYFSTGAYIGYLLHGDFRFEVDGDQPISYRSGLSDDLRKINLGAYIGLGLQAHFNRFVLSADLGYQAGLVNLSKHPEDDRSAFTEDYYLSGGYRISALTLQVGLLYSLSDH